MNSTVCIMDMWVVYEKPLDFPELFVARRWEVTPSGGHPTNEIRQAESLEAIRQQLPRGLQRLARNPQDDAVIAEVWL